MLGRLLDKSSREELLRVLEQPVEKWEAWGYRFPSGAACFVGVVCGVVGERISPTHGDLWLSREDSDRIGEWKERVGAHKLYTSCGSVEDVFDGLLDRFGHERVVAAIRARAQRVLDRHNQTQE